jgi:hypothetical protein
MMDGIRSRNFKIVVSSGSQYIRIFGLTASRVKDILLPFTSGSFRNSTLEFLDPENMGIVVGNYLLSCLEVVAQVLPVWRPPYSIKRLPFTSHRIRWSL